MAWGMNIMIAVLLVLGLVGSVLPALPGPPLSFIALLLGCLFGPEGSVSVAAVVIFGILTVSVSVVDYVAPAWFAKKGGASRQAVRGTIIGTVCGFFFLPWGLIAGPFIGALLGERFHAPGVPWGKSLKIASWSLVAFLLTTGAKLALCAAIAVYLFVRFFR